MGGYTGVYGRDENLEYKKLSYRKLVKFVSLNIFLIKTFTNR